MGKPLSLAEYLGTVDHFESGDSTPDYDAHKSIEERAKEILSSPEYRLSLYKRIITGELNPSLEKMLYVYAYGNPTVHIERKDLTENPYKDVPTSKLRELLSELLNRADQIQDVIGDDDADSVH